jgi:GGDEF domain-containing protein
MDTVSAAFWGAFFGTVGLMLAGALFAFARSLQRVALSAAMSALVSAFFVVAYLGWLPVGNENVQARLLAHVAIATSSLLAFLLLAMLGLLRGRGTARRAARGLAIVAATVILVGWALEPVQAMALSSLTACALAFAGLAICVRSALRGDRLAWAAVSAVFFMLAAVMGLSWNALQQGQVHWSLHAVTATAGIAYLATMASVLWARYSYLIELREVMAHGPAYDPVTRMRSHADLSQMVGAAFYTHEGESFAMGVIVVSIGNLLSLEKLHGRAAVNHALFICAGRLRRAVPAKADMGRLSDDGFLILLKNSHDHARLVQLARNVRERLSRPVALSTSRDPQMLETGQTHWVADVGVGVLAASAAHIKGTSAVAMARAMSRTAWSYGSRVAWFDNDAGQIAELPTLEPA